MVMESEDGNGGGATTSDRGEGAVVVVVGVKLDSRSRELLTWALVKVARPGDRVFALHVLDSITESEEKIIPQVKRFDSMLAAYNGFCNLKQIDLKLKVSRGSPVRSVLVNEAKSFGAASLIVGTSGVNRTMRSSVLVAKYCAKHLSKNFSVLAVDNGKVLFEREATTLFVCDSQDDDRNKNHVPSFHASLRKSSKSNGRRNILEKKISCSAFKTVLPEDSCNQLTSSRSGNENNSMSLVPIKSQQLYKPKPGWELLRQLFFHNQKTSKQTAVKKISLIQWVKLPSRKSLAAVYPCKKQIIPEKDACHSSNSDAEKGVTAAHGTDATSLPFSPAYCLKSIPKELEGFCEIYSPICRLFSYQELLLATSNFMPDNMIGKGGSSQVYIGQFPDGKELAVKILKPSEDVLKQFVSEIKIITALQHKNVISLLGFCFEENHLLLVYDFLSRGSLEENLHGNREKTGKAFGWECRYKVALGIAEALDYLHNGAAEPVIHRDVKSSNILLLDDFEPLLSDFGFAIWASSSVHHMDCNDVAGTFGYLAPEYFMHGKMNEKVDVYAFGVVLLELLSGRKAIDNENPKESLVIWAKQILKGEVVNQLLDPSFGSDYDHDQFEKMVLAASLCIKNEPRFRPQISLVLKLLQGERETLMWSRQQASVSEDGDAGDGEQQSPTNIQYFLNLVMRNVEDDSVSISSTEQSVSVEDYLEGRRSGSSSFA